MVTNDIFFVTHRLLDSFMLPNGFIGSDQASNAFFLDEDVAERVPLAVTLTCILLLV